MTRQNRSIKSYWNTPDATMSLGCRTCPDLGLCGGQTIHAGGFDCLEHCCNDPQNCRSVCPNAVTFADRIREVSGLSLETGAAARLKPPNHSGYVPLVFHDSARTGLLAARAVAMPLYRFFDQFGDCRYGSRGDVSRGFKVERDAEIFLSGVAHDNEVEKWWKLQARGRVKAIANLRHLGVAMVTTPNFSLMVDRPRWDDLHSMKRIVEVYHELVSEGQPSALHVNGRAQRDFERWADHIVTHPEVTHLAYEFTTGTRNAVRMRQHMLWLISVAEMAGRRLGLIIRGGIQVAQELAGHFDVTFIDTSAFKKAHHRFVATIDESGHRRWEKRNTPQGAAIDDLLAENVGVSELWMQGILPKFALCRLICSRHPSTTTMLMGLAAHISEAKRQCSTGNRSVPIASAQLSSLRIWQVSRTDRPFPKPAGLMETLTARTLTLAQGRRPIGFNRMAGVGSSAATVWPVTKRSTVSR